MTENNCHHRSLGIGRSDAFSYGGKVAISGGRPICGVQSDYGELDPACELPQTSENDCPIALCAAGIISLEEANNRLESIFAQRKRQSS